MTRRCCYWKLSVVIGKSTANSLRMNVLMLLWMLLENFAHFRKNEKFEA